MQLNGKSVQKKRDHTDNISFLHLASPSETPVNNALKLVNFNVSPAARAWTGSWKKAQPRHKRKVALKSAFSLVKLASQVRDCWKSQGIN